MFGQIAQTFLPATPYDPTGKNSVDGFYYNIQDLTSLRSGQLDEAAAVGSPVAVIFDRWITNTLGSDTVTNGDFPTATTGWTGSSAALTINSAQLRVTNTVSAVGRAHQSQTTVVGTTYKVTVDLITNADGANISVGTTNGGTNLFTQDIAATVTGSYTFYFTATTTTSFIQLRTNIATSTKFTEWDNVTCKSVAGRHLMNTGGSSVWPTLRQDSNGYYYLEFGTSDVLYGANTWTLDLPMYMCYAHVNSSTNGRAFSVGLSGSNNFVLTRTGTATTGTYRIDWASPEQTSHLSGVNNDYPAGRLCVVDALMTYGASSITINRRELNTSANTWSTTAIAGCRPTMNGLFTSTSNNNTLIYAVVGMKVDPGADRAGIRSWLANLAGAD